MTKKTKKTFVLILITISYVSNKLIVILCQYLNATHVDAEKSASYQRGLATKQSILDGAHWLIDGAQDGDHLFFHYSGHGTQVKDVSGDEEGDGMDEAICPMDYTSKGLIVDDELNAILVKNLPKGVRLTAILDCCHSGSGLDLPYFYQPKENEEIAQSKKKKKNKKEKKEKKSKIAKDDRGVVVMLSGCKDEQVSADVVLEGKATGAVSYAFITSLYEADLQLSYSHLLSNMKEVIRSNVQSIIQCPMLSSNIPDFDFNATFFA